MKFIYISIFSMAFVTSSFAQTWYTNPANGHRYTKITDNASWVDSEQLATSLGGHLATINDASENEWVYSTFLPYNFDWMWIGLYEVDYNQRTWAWSSGEPLTYLNWAPGEPSGPGAEHWVAMEGPSYWDGQWADLSTPWSPPIVHIGVVEVVPEPATIGILGLGSLALIRKRK